MRKALVSMLIYLLAITTVTASDQITFSGNESSIVLRDGRESVVLSEGASVSVGSLSISADRITLSGDGWTRVECSGNAAIRDDERSIAINTSNVFYDRTTERILISSWFEIDDTANSVSATGAYLEYRLDDEHLQMDKSVTLLKDTDSGIMRCRAESVVFSRTANTLELRGDASVYWDGDEYGAEVIRVDLNTDSISLEGRIRGNING